LTLALKYGTVYLGCEKIREYTVVGVTNSSLAPCHAQATPPWTHPALSFCFPLAASMQRPPSGLGKGTAPRWVASRGPDAVSSCS